MHAQPGPGTGHAGRTTITRRTVSPCVSASGSNHLPGCASATLDPDCRRQGKSRGARAPATTSLRGRAHGTDPGARLVCRHPSAPSRGWPATPGMFRTRKLHPQAGVACHVRDRRNQACFLIAPEPPSGREIPAWSGIHTSTSAPSGSALMWYVPLSRKLRTVAKVSSMNCTKLSRPSFALARIDSGDVTVLSSVLER